MYMYMYTHMYIVYYCDTCTCTCIWLHETNHTFVCLCDCLDTDEEAPGSLGNSCTVGGNLNTSALYNATVYVTYIHSYRPFTIM